MKVQRHSQLKLYYLNVDNTDNVTNYTWFSNTTGPDTMVYINFDRIIHLDYPVFKQESFKCVYLMFLVLA